MSTVLFLVATAFFGISLPVSTEEDKILGLWADADQTGVLEFVKNGSEYEAVIREAIEPAYIGRTQIESLKHHKGNSYKGGTIHLYARNRTAGCSAELISDTELKLKISAGPVTKTRILTRTNPGQWEARMRPSPRPWPLSARSDSIPRKMTGNTQMRSFCPWRASPRVSQ